MKERPLLSFTACWVVGCAVACLFSGRWLLLVWVGLVLLLVITAISGKLSWKYVAMLCLSVTLSGLYWNWNESRNRSELPEMLGLSSSALNEVSVKADGKIVSAVERDGDRVDFSMRLSQLTLVEEGEHSWPNTRDELENKLYSELVMVQIKLQAEEEIAVAAKWQRGDQVVLTGVLEEPAEARNFGGFDYQSYLLTKKIHWLLKGEGAYNVRITSPEAWSFSTILRWNDAVRVALGSEMDRLFDKRHSGYMKGLVIGMQDDLDPDTFQQFSQLGLTHILAISGMHVAVYVGVLLFILKCCRLTKETALTVTLVLVPLYVLLSGAGPSIVRAGIMSMIALFAARVGVLKDGLNILGASALVMLIWSPYMLLSVSFQLSFLVTLGLMIYVPLVDSLLKRLPRWLKSTLSVTLVAQLVSFPLTIYYFNQFSLLSLVANLIFVPFITFIILPLGTVALVLGRLWDGAARVLAQMTEQLNNATFYAVEWINGFSGGVLIWRSPSLLWICGYYVLLYGLLYAAKQIMDMRNVPQYMEDETRPLDGVVMPQGRNGRSEGTWKWDSQHFMAAPKEVGWSRVVVLLCATGLGIMLYKGYQSESYSGAGMISYLDVGQGDSILITTPSGAHILVDGGGTLNFGQREEWRIRRSPFEVGAKVLVPLLKKRGIHRLDAVILTHGDQDHAGGLQAVLEGIPVSALLFNGTMVDRDAYKELMRTAMDANVKLYAVNQGMTISPDADTELSFLWPVIPSEAESDLPLREEQNHDSVAFRMSMNGRSFLFTGDMDVEAEEEIVETAMRNGIRRGPSIDVLKVAHHGSKTSTGDTWLQFWNPATAVISAGVNNLYGHPNAAVIERLSSNQIAVFRTDKHGEIQMRVRADGIEVRYKLGQVKED